MTWVYYFCASNSFLIRRIILYWLEFLKSSLLCTRISQASNLAKKIGFSKTEIIQDDLKVTHVKFNVTQIHKYR